MSGAMGCLRLLGLLILLPVGLACVWVLPNLNQASTHTHEPLARFLSGRAEPGMRVVSGEVALLPGATALRAPESRVPAVAYRAVLTQFHKYEKTVRPKRGAPYQGMGQQPIVLLTHAEAVPFQVKAADRTYVVRGAVTQWRLDDEGEPVPRSGLPAWAKGLRLGAPVVTGKYAGDFTTDEAVLRPGDVVTVIGRVREANGEATVTPGSDGLWLLDGSAASWRDQLRLADDIFVVWGPRVGWGSLGLLVLIFLPWRRRRRA